jgi:hypothetical protein
MKTIVKVILPVLAFTLASAAAVSNNKTKVADAKKPLITGFIQNPSAASCLQVSVDCSTTITNQVCMSSESTPRQVWLKNAANACNVSLFKVIH